MASASDVAISSEELPLVIDQEIASYKDILTENGLPGLQKKIHENSEKWKNTKLKIAVTGELKAGKSSLINSLRDLTGDDEGAANVGETHTTKVISVYNHPRNGNFQLYDLPGIGAVDLTKDKYFEKIDFDQFDFFLIVSNKAFSRYDMDLVEAIMSRQKTFYFVRTCIDTSIINDKRSHPNSHDKNTVLKNVRDECMENLKAIGLHSPNIFLIDNYDKRNLDYEFGKLETKMMDDADMLKVDAMVFSLSALTLDHLQKKMDLLCKRIPEKALEVACAGTVDEQKKIFEKEIRFYQQQFDIHEQFLKNPAMITLEPQTFRGYVVAFDQNDQDGEIDVETPTQRRSKMSVFRRFVDFFLAQFNNMTSMLFRFSTEGLDENLRLLHRMATTLHTERTLTEMAVHNYFQFDKKKTETKKS